MKIVERTGDILSPVKTDKPYYNDVTICYQTNCYGVMSDEFGKQINRRWSNICPALQQYSMRKWLKSLLGEVFFVPVEKDMKVALIFAQEGYGTNGLYTDYAVLCAALFTVFKENINCTVRIPYGFGSEIGGSDWSTVLAIIKAASAQWDGTIEIWKPAK